jgi:hypothetical protein
MDQKLSEVQGTAVMQFDQDRNIDAAAREAGLN